MLFTVGERAVFAATGGRPHAADRPPAVLLHGAGMDHSAWALQSRWLAFRGWNVLAVDLPGHGRSAGPPLTSIGALAAWLIGLLDAAGGAGSPTNAGAPALLIGHSMGALIALETAAQAPGRVRGLVLIGAAAVMPVHKDLLAAAAANDHAAIDMVNLWGYGYAAGLGGSRAPGVWMLGTGERILERAAPGVLYADLAACDAYQSGAASSAAVTAPALLICGERDQMTPLRSGRALTKALPGAELVAVRGAGHMLLAEHPYAVQDAIAEFVKRV